MAPQLGSKSLSASALSSLLGRRAAAAAALPSKYARRKDRNSRRRGKGYRTSMGNHNDDHDDDDDVNNNDNNTDEGIDIEFETHSSKDNKGADENGGSSGNGRRKSLTTSHGSMSLNGQSERMSKARVRIEERVMQLKRQRRISREEREVRKRIMDLRSGKTRHIPKKKPQQSFGEDTDDDL